MRITISRFSISIQYIKSIFQKLGIHELILDIMAMMMMLAVMNVMPLKRKRKKKKINKNKNYQNKEKENNEILKFRKNEQIIKTNKQLIKLQIIKQINKQNIKNKSKQKQKQKIIKIQKINQYKILFHFFIFLANIFFLAIYFNIFQKFQSIHKIIHIFFSFWSKKIKFISSLSFLY
ncbi:transmembrane protein, putative (macronuclear) [Tetrahymena thermophila SB210]|uniref:Transmembrane protein, putative n=1 Tax=Tetrahymena thermophila (strain SB210) TaxID=312017 RepID=W7XDJ5_TETTS|nr:transmembrane protein, putative [Tetrahymena thermophila SB210]EWS71911.1 transmembrane protein, putative [Tetrahymena thermophila SB210]|eukprot:XP_012655540.1 transmembrane protein, putative [Tetrahymena thermophila SB210]